ncbi:glutaredoxin domain-containing protein [Mycolicibacterium fallax]|uniref:glutaredoxin domain-containing protein n=1 Tax=Mycolicibacterium fallax TaxID=1793 RepID=UPI000A152A26|nr:glutaredoxin domain-containing protein [Mycolicibacterium fallax]
MDTTSNTVIYSKPGCHQCTATERQFDKLALPYRSVDITTDPAAAQTLSDMGFAAVPVVVAEGHQPWSGFRPDRISALAADRTAQQPEAHTSAEPVAVAAARQWAETLMASPRRDAAQTRRGEALAL